MACACKPEAGVKCMWHFDLDGYIIGTAIAKADAETEQPEPLEPSTEPSANGEANGES